MWRRPTGSAVSPPPFRSCHPITANLVLNIKMPRKGGVTDQELPPFQLWCNVIKEQRHVDMAAEHRATRPGTLANSLRGETHQGRHTRGRPPGTFHRTRCRASRVLGQPTGWPWMWRSSGLNRARGFSWILGAMPRSGAEIGIRTLDALPGQRFESFDNGRWAASSSTAAFLRRWHLPSSHPTAELIIPSGLSSRTCNSPCANRVVQQCTPDVSCPANQTKPLSFSSRVLAQDEQKQDKLWSKHASSVVFLRYDLLCRLRHPFHHDSRSAASLKQDRPTHPRTAAPAAPATEVNRARASAAALLPRSRNGNGVDFARSGHRQRSGEGRGAWLR